MLRFDRKQQNFVKQLSFNKFKISFLETSGIFFPKYAFIIIIIIIIIEG